MSSRSSNYRPVGAVIVAHPDDETLWAGGTILTQDSWEWHIITLCRGSDADRAPRFRQALQTLNATGGMADLDDGPEQRPLEFSEVQAGILSLLPAHPYDLVLTHSPNGEYTRHLRHEEVSRAVVSLWSEQKLATRELWCFAYDDGARSHLPLPIEHASCSYMLPEDVWMQKYRIITEVYGFPSDGFEARVTPRVEAFWRFRLPSDVQHWLAGEGELQ